MNELEEYLLTNNTVIYEDNYFISYKECKIDLDFLLSNIYIYTYYLVNLQTRELT
jgi:hypothetical protein